MKSYALQIHAEKDLIHVNVESKVIQMHLSVLLQGLKEVGYEIKPPPSQLYIQAKNWLVDTWGEDNLLDQSGSILSALNKETKKSMRMDIHDIGVTSLSIWHTGLVFAGHVTTIDEFIMAFKLTGSI